MHTHTYAKASAYDFEYIALANALLPVLEDYDDFFEPMGLDQFDLVELAVILVAYFEDCINEIGVWKAFVTYNEERFGYSLPFYERRDDYDTDYINPEDFSFLTWQWLMERHAQQTIFSPYADPIINLGEDLYALLEDKIEEASADDAQAEFLTFGEDANFFKVRDAMHWRMLRNYLLGQLGLRRRVDAHIADEFKEDIARFGPQQL